MQIVSGITKLSCANDIGWLECFGFPSVYFSLPIHILDGDSQNLVMPMTIPHEHHTLKDGITRTVALSDGAW